MLNFRSKIAQKVLSYLLLNPQTELYLNEMAAKFGVDRGNLVKKLVEWKKEGIVQKRKRGNLSLYRINETYPLYKELRAITEKQFGLEDVLRDALRRVKGVGRAYIFGSYVRGKFGPESDVDILVIGLHKAADVQRQITRIQKKFDRDINVVDMTERELNKRKISKDPLIARIFKGSNIRII